MLSLQKGEDITSELGIFVGKEGGGGKMFCHLISINTSSEKGEGFMTFKFPLVGVSLEAMEMKPFHVLTNTFSPPK